MKYLPLVVLVLIALPTGAQSKRKKDQPCDATFQVAWTEGGTDGMNDPQLEWWDKHGKKRFAGFCYAADTPDTTADWTIQFQTFHGADEGVGGAGKVIFGSGGTHTRIYYVLYHNGKREGIGRANSTWESSEEATYHVVLENALLELGKRLKKER